MGSQKMAAAKNQGQRESYLSLPGAAFLRYVYRRSFEIEASRFGPMSSITLRVSGEIRSGLLRLFWGRINEVFGLHSFSLLPPATRKSMVGSGRVTGFRQSLSRLE